MQKLDEILEMIKSGKISIRQASEQFGLGRDFLKSNLIKKYGQTETGLQEINDLMDGNKSNATIQIDEENLQSVFLKVVNGEMLLEEAQKELGGIDIETLKNKFWDFVKDSKSPELLKKYREYQSKKQHTDYSNINFRLVAIRMMRYRMNQTEIATEMDLTPRTISREFEKFKFDEDKTLYNLIKFYNDKAMRRQKLSVKEVIFLDEVLDAYERKHPDLLVEHPKSKTEIRNQKMRDLVLGEKQLKAQGFSQEEIAKKLGTSISGLRRARIFVEKQEILERNKKSQSGGSTPKTSPDTDDEVRE